MLKVKLMFCQSIYDMKVSLHGIWREWVIEQHNEWRLGRTMWYAYKSSLQSANSVHFRVEKPDVQTKMTK
jgi:hypothetical protein